MASTASSEVIKKRPFSIVRLADKVTKELQAIYNTNKTDSPLLHLPPEVRNRIWHFALGGKTIIVKDYKKCCTCTTTYYNLDAALRMKDGSSAGTVGFYGHFTCGDVHMPAIRSLSLALLSTSRQIHAEAALLPFSDNTFTFRTFRPLLKFLQRLRTGQARAITAITLIGPAKNTRPTRWQTQEWIDLGQLRRLSQAKLTGTRAAHIL